MAMASESLLDLHRRKLDDRQSESAKGHDHHAARLNYGDGVAGSVKEKLFNGCQFRAPSPDQLTQVSGNLHHPRAF
ncbi:MAG: Uncharacterised protein [Synechococcus sp. MIT S9220]|nr:MAG: Uncharacterised protein [Synechococcus sp. MIT S9220]